MARSDRDDFDEGGHPVAVGYLSLPTSLQLIYRRFDGSMSQAQRATTIEEFGKKTNEPLILLISLKAGGVGLNLSVVSFFSKIGSADDQDYGESCATPRFDEIFPIRR